MKLIDSIAAPGSKLGGGMKPGAGDDRYVFDEWANWACVIDGATDVGLVRLYPKAESDAAWYADMFAGQLLALPIGVEESPEIYFPRLTERLREKAEKAARVKLADAPLSCLPTAAATWVRRRGGKLECATLGDTMAIIRLADGSVQLAGDNQKQEDETKSAKTVMQMSAEDRAKWLRDLREQHNRPDGYWVFGVQTEAATHIRHQVFDCPKGARALVMSDGFYRLVSPYGRYSDAELIERASAIGLGRLLNELRSLERSPEDDARIGRYKTSDDATALLLEF